MLSDSALNVGYATKLIPAGELIRCDLVGGRGFGRLPAEEPALSAVERVPACRGCFLSIIWNPGRDRRLARLLYYILVYC